MSMLVNNIIDKLENSPDYEENGISGQVTLHFENVYALQEFVAEIRKQGLKYGYELANLDKRKDKCVKKPEGLSHWRDFVQGSSMPTTNAGAK